MHRELTRSFGRGVRLGVLICSLAVMLTVVGSLEVTSPIEPLSASNEASPSGRTAPATVAVFEGAPIDAGVAARGTPLADHEIDPILIKAARARQQELREMVFQLSVAPAPYPATDPSGIPIEPPLLEIAPPVTEVVAARVPERVPVRAPVVVAGDALRGILGPVFGDQAEAAYTVVMCESSGNASAHTGNGYYGMWQFDLATWASVGGSGYPSDASAVEQVQRAKRLYDARGWQPWGCRPASHGGVPTVAPTPTPTAPVAEEPSTGAEATPTPSQPAN